MGRLMTFVALAGALLGLTSPSPASAAPEPTVTVVTQKPLHRRGSLADPGGAGPRGRPRGRWPGVRRGSGEPSSGADGGGRR
jgi:hypothetical protein